MPSGDLPLDVLDGLATLVDTSLLRREEGADGEPRLVMLETIREYALEQLEASDEAEQVRRRHAAHFLALAETAAPHLEGRERGTWLDRLDLEHDNLRAALGWALGGGAAELGARIALALAGHGWSSFWRLRGHGSEALRWLEHVVEQSNQLTPSQRAWALIRIDGYRGIQWIDVLLWVIRRSRCFVKPVIAPVLPTSSKLAEVTPVFSVIMRRPRSSWKKHWRYTEKSTSTRASPAHSMGWAV